MGNKFLYWSGISLCLVGVFAYVQFSDFIFSEVLLPAQSVLLTVTVVPPDYVPPEPEPEPEPPVPRGGADSPASFDISPNGKIDLADFSVLAYWYKRPLTDEVKTKVDLNKDGKVDLVDFSILAYYWNRKI